MISTLFKRTALALALATPLAAWSQVSLSVTIAPPPLPLYAQPPIPVDGYLWTPGYWAWDAFSGDYIWVPGTWVMPPSQGLLVPGQRLRVASQPALRQPHEHFRGRPRPAACS